MNISCNSSFGALISENPRWTPFHERISAGNVGMNSADKTMQERTTNSPIVKKKLGFQGLFDQTNSDTDIDDVIGVCSGKFLSLDATMSQEAAVTASGDLISQQPTLSPDISDLKTLERTRVDLTGSQDIEDYEDELVKNQPVKSHDNKENNLIDEEEIVEGKTVKPKSIVCSPIISGPVRQIQKTMLRVRSRAVSSSKETEKQQASLVRPQGIQDNSTRQIGEGQSGRGKFCKGCMECVAGKANCVVHGLPAKKTKLHVKQVGGKNARSGQNGGKRKYGTVVEIVKSEKFDTTWPKRSRDIRNGERGKKENKTCYI